MGVCVSRESPSAPVSSSASAPVAQTSVGGSAIVTCVVATPVYAMVLPVDASQINSAEQKRMMANPSDPNAPPSYETVEVPQAVQVLPEVCCLASIS